MEYAESRERRGIKGECSPPWEERELEKQVYDDLIRNQSKMPGDNLLAEAVVKYYLFQLDKLKAELPYDAMGCELTIPLMIQREFQRETIIEDILEVLEDSNTLDREELQKEIQKFLRYILKNKSYRVRKEQLDGRANR